MKDQEAIDSLVAKMTAALQGGCSGRQALTEAEAALFDTFQNMISRPKDPVRRSDRAEKLAEAGVTYADAIIDTANGCVIDHKFNELVKAKSALPADWESRCGVVVAESEAFTNFALHLGSGKKHELQTGESVCVVRKAVQG